MSLLGPEKEKAGEVRVDPALMKLLTSDTRRSVLRRLGKRRMNLTELAREIGLKKATVLEHLRRLEEAELVTRKEDDRLWVYYELTPTARSLVDPVGTRIMLVLGVTIAALAVVATMFVFANAQLGLWGTTPDDTGPGTLGISLHGFHDTHVGSGVDIQGAWSEADPEHGPFTAYLLDDEARSALLAGEPWHPHAALTATAHPDGLQVHGDPAVDPGEYWLYLQDAHNNDNRNEMPLLQLRLPPVELSHNEWWRGLDDAITVSLPATAGDEAPQIALFAAHQDPERQVWESEDATVRLPPEALDNKSAGSYELHYRAAGSDRWVFLEQTIEILVPKFDVVPHTLVEGSDRALNVFVSASGDARPDAFNVTLNGEHILMERATPGRGVFALDRVDPGQLQVQIGRLANTTVPVIPDLDVAITLEDGPELHFQIKNATGEPERDVQVRLDQEILGTTDHQGQLRVAPPLAQGDSRLVFKTDSGHELPWRVNVNGWDLQVRPQQVQLGTGSADRPILHVDIENPDPWPINTTLVGSKDGSIYTATAIHLQGGQWRTLELPVAEVDLNATKYHVHAEGPALKQPSYRNQTSQEEPQQPPSGGGAAPAPTEPAYDDYETDDSPSAFFGEIVSTSLDPMPAPTAPTAPTEPTEPSDPVAPTDPTDPSEADADAPEQESPALPVLLVVLGTLLVLLWARGRPPRPRGS